MAKNKYDRDYCDDDKNFKKKGCRHAGSSAIRDAKFEGEEMVKAQKVCTICGKVVGWMNCHI